MSKLSKPVEGANKSFLRYIAGCILVASKPKRDPINGINVLVVEISLS